MNGTGYCGDFTTCTNSDGSFSCPCITGYVEHTAWTGCRDKNECTEGGHNCAANTDCSNLPGSWNCTCKPGYTGNPYSGCIDIDECAYEDLNTCTGGLWAEGRSADVWGEDEHQTPREFPLEPEVNTESSGWQEFQFSVRAKQKPTLGFCNSGGSCYKFVLGKWNISPQGAISIH